MHVVRPYFCFSYRFTESGHTITLDQTKPGYVTRWNEYTLWSRIGIIIAKMKNDSFRDNERQLSLVLFTD